MSLIFITTCTSTLDENDTQITGAFSTITAAKKEQIKDIKQWHEEAEQSVPEIQWTRLNAYWRFKVLTGKRDDEEDPFEGYLMIWEIHQKTVNKPIN